ncbi:hypothetical protein HDU67_000809 [Dinochytrium kinnereticum]|nr:hypothetical protein HDU67_000809 [Dinochytrium kinnereticum]
MGKHQRKRYNKGKKARQDPLGLSSATATSENSKATSQQIIPIVQKLGSQKPDDRSWAAAAISNLVLEASTRLELSKGKVAPALVNALKVETHLGVIIEILGAMRNLVSFSDDEVALEFFGLNCTDVIMPHLTQVREVVAFLAEGRKPSTEEEAEQLKLKLELSEQVLVILWSFSEISFEVVQTISSKDVLALLFFITESYKTTPHNIIQSAAQILNTISDDNSPVVEAIRQEDRAVQLLRACVCGEIPDFNTWEENRFLTRILMGSLLYNIYGADFEVYKAILNAVSFSLSFNFEDTFSKCENIAKASGDLLQSKGIEDLSQSVTSSLGTVQFTLELLTNMFSEESAKESAWEEAQANGDSEMNAEDDDDEDYVDMQEDTEEESESSKIMQRSLGLVEESNLIPQILKICGISCKALLGSESTAHIVTHASVVRIRAFSCLSNMFTIASSTDWFQRNVSGLAQVWGELFQMAQLAIGEAPVSAAEGGKADVTESIISLLWAIARGFDGINNGQGAKLLPLADDHITALIHFSSTGSKPIRVMCVGVLSILGKIQGAIERNLAIGNFFMNLLSTEDSVDVFAEVLNGIYDIYADKTFDYDYPVFVTQGYLQKLKMLFEKLRAKVKALNKRQNRAVRERGDEAIMNLKAFIQYKEKE